VLLKRRAFAPELVPAEAAAAALDGLRPGAEDTAQDGIGRAGDLTEGGQPVRVQLLLCDRANARELAHRQRTEACRLFPRCHKQHAAWLGECARDLGHRAARRDARAGRQADAVLDFFRELAHHALDRAVEVPVPGQLIQAFAAREVEEHFVDARDLGNRSVPLSDAPNAVGVVPINAVARRQEDGVRCELGGASERDAGADAIRTHFVARRGHHAALPRMTPDDDRFAVEARIEQPLDRHEEGVEVEAADARRRESHDELSRIADHTFSAKCSR
jgi:hypothetical protein